MRNGAIIKNLGKHNTIAEKTNSKTSSIVVETSDAETWAIYSVAFGRKKRKTVFGGPQESAVRKSRAYTDVPLFLFRVRFARARTRRVQITNV